ncbi:MAG: redoxin domain-containing protein, partial [Candidatus Delongbacteria bacterium]|nr:redoxin domain-containing protein [Candidatus Delongbacteria bacterium]
MKKMITVMTMLLLTAMSFGAYQVGDVVENFTFKASTGGEPVDITLYDLIDQGKVVWFDFSETWCVPCQAEAPVLEETWNEFGKEDGPLFICAAITDVNSWDNVNGSSWRTKFDPNLTYWLSTSTELGAYSSDFNGTGYIPYNVLIGPDYKVYYSDSGFNHNGTMAIIKDLLGIIPPTNVEAVVSGSEVSLNWTAPNGGSSGEPEELIFDEGEVHDGYKWVGATMSSRLTPAAAGKILTLKYFITSGTSGFNAEVYDWTGTQPGDMLATYPATGVENDWV